MRRRCATALAVWALAITVLAHGQEPEAAPAEPSLPPIGAFTDADAIGTIQISPGGDYLAFIMRGEGEEERATFRVLTRPDHEIKINRNFEDNRGISELIWVEDHRLVVVFRSQSFGGLMTVSAKSGNASKLSCGEGAFFCGLLDALPQDPKHVLLMGFGSRFGDVRKMRTDGAGRAQVIAEGAAPRGGFIPTNDGDIAFSTGENANNQTEVYYREGRDRWQLVASQSYGKPGWIPLRHTGRERKFYTSDSREAATAGLGIYDSQKDEHEEIVVRHPVVDVGPLLLDAENRAWGVRFDHHYSEVVYLLPNHPLAKKHAMLREAFPDHTIAFTSSTRDYDLSVAEISNDRKPGDFVLVDVAAKRIEPIASRRPALPPEQLGMMQPVELKVRDGTTLYGYVTSLPSAPKPGPMVVLPHGGPHGIRDTWRFNWEAQLLASRGYHVLQVNFRGSGGYGNEYLAAGFGEWGGRMQDDVTDATRWAIANGVADPERICILGGSYGAYSALMGAAREPDLYRCAVGIAGIYDLEAMDKYGDVRASRAGLRFMAQVLGEPAERRARSPVRQAERIRAAVMLVHGVQDRRAPLEHAQRMRDALREAGNDVEWHAVQNQGHRISGRDERRSTYGRILTFLANHLGASA